METILENFLNSEEPITENINWIIETDSLMISSVEDLYLGYILGSISRLLHEVVRNTRLLNESKRGRLPNRKKSLDATKKEINQIREMIRLRLPDLRRRVFRELNI